ncbi:MAG TPA: aspartate/glutamate racemase family protein [Kofleriaceae bacterium]|nr:aspartate/glutamate racemase family protein [Kofleriaceae bacterium]
MLGVLGGLGPLASAKFMESIYLRAPFDNEAKAPRVVMVSDPAFPDRTTALLRGQSEELRVRTEGCLRQLVELGAERIIICCFTLHAIVPQLAAGLRSRVASLPDLALREVLAAPSSSPTLMLCTTGARAAHVFDGEALWPQVADRIIQLSEPDQARFHELIYSLKRKLPPEQALESIRALCRDYGASSWIAGCTELHLVSNWMLHNAVELDVIDPLLTVTNLLATGELP